MRLVRLRRNGPGVSEMGPGCMGMSGGGLARSMSPGTKRLMDQATLIDMAQTWLRLAQEENQPAPQSRLEEVAQHAGKQEADRNHSAIMF